MLFLGFYLYPKSSDSKPTSLVSFGNSSKAILDGNRVADYSSAINPADYQCGPTIFQSWISSVVRTMTSQDIANYNAFWYLALDYAVYFSSDQDGIFGPNGEFTDAITRVFRDLKRFWDIPTNIEIRAAHASVFTDLAKLERLLSAYGYPAPNTLAQSVATKFSTPGLIGNPLLTLNAFAVPAGDYGIVLGNEIVMGDGILQAYQTLGFGDVAPQSILAHEYGHHVQFANPELVQFVNTPEGTRKTELMADGLAAYYLVHKRGLALNKFRIASFLEVFFSIGDCSFRSNGHHGTPNQRRKAAEWGFNLAASAKNNGAILPAKEVIALFNNDLPTLLAPDK